MKRKIDLTVVKSFLASAESTIAEAEALYKEDDKGVQVEFLNGLAKAMGLLLATMQEANMLVGDIKQIVKYNSTPQQSLGDIQSLLAKQLYGVDPDEGDGGVGGSGFGGGFN